MMTKTVVHTVEPSRGLYLFRRMLLVGLLAAVAAGGWTYRSYFEAGTGPPVAAPGDTQIGQAQVDDAGAGSSAPAPAPPSASQALQDLESESESVPMMVDLRTQAPGDGGQEQALARRSRFVARDPERVLDTRQDRPPSADDQLTIDVPDGWTAAVLSVSLIGASGAGPVLVDGRAGTVEAVNAAGAGATTTNLVVVPQLGGRLTVRSATGGHLVIDVVGGFEPSGPTAVGRFVVDRAGVQIARLETAVDGRVATLDLAAVSGAATGPVLLAINADVGADGGVVRIGPAADSYDQMLMWGPAGSTQPQRRGLLMVQPGADGLAHLRYDGGSLLTAEVVGYFTDSSAAVDVSGLFVPTGPRLVTADPVESPAGLLVQDLPIEQGSLLVTVASETAAARSGSLVVPVVDGRATIASATQPSDRSVVLGVFL